MRDARSVPQTPCHFKTRGLAKSYLSILSPHQSPEGTAQEGENEHAFCFGKTSLFA